MPSIEYETLSPEFMKDLLYAPAARDNVKRLEATDSPQMFDLWFTRITALLRGDPGPDEKFIDPERVRKRRRDQELSKNDAYPQWENLGDILVNGDRYNQKQHSEACNRIRYGLTTELRIIVNDYINSRNIMWPTASEMMGIVELHGKGWKHDAWRE